MGRPAGSEGEAPSVFVSWAHRDSGMTEAQAADWLDLVHDLAQSLTASGCVVRADIYEQDVDWSRWGPEMIDKCAFTLIVSSRAYCERWNGSNPPEEGAGAAREINVLKGRFDKNQQKFRNRTAIVLLPGITKDDVPDEIYAYLQRFCIDPANGNGIEALLRYLTRQPEFVLPSRGALPFLPPRPNGIRRGESQENSSKGALSAGSAPTWLPAATPQQGLVSRLLTDIENSSPPPSRASVNDEADVWMAELANWTDDMSSLVDEIERVRPVITKNPSVRFIQVLDDTHAKIEILLEYLNGSRAAVGSCFAADAAAELYELIKKLARLALEL